MEAFGWSFLFRANSRFCPINDKRGDIMKALRNFKHGNKEILKGTSFEEAVTTEQINTYIKYKFIGTDKKKKAKKVKDGGLQENTK